MQSKLDLKISLSHDVGCWSDITSFIIYKVMKYRKVWIIYNAFLKQLYYTCGPLCERKPVFGVCEQQRCRPVYAD